MNALYHGSIQRMATTGNAVTRKAAASPMSVHRTSRRPRVFFTLLLSRRLGDGHIRGRHVLMARARGGRHLRNLVDDVHARGDLAEYRVTVVRRAGMIEETVVHQVDEELRGGAVDVIGARHGEGAAGILEAVGGFVLD